MTFNTETQKTPTVEHCYQIIAGCKMLPNIIKHSEQVMRVALSIYDNLKPGIRLNRDLIAAASLLHDIKKTESLNTKEPHDIKGADFIRELGYSALAEIIAEHVILNNFYPDGSILEKEIVFYADKRVMHDRIVSVKKRIKDILIRYGDTEERRNKILKNKELILQVEKKINRNLTNNIDNILCYDDVSG